jgi:Na+(H+)/acetate symporter ActP
MKKSVERVSPNPELGLTARQVQERAVSGWKNISPKSASRTEGEIIAANCLTFFNFVFGVLALILVLSASMSTLSGLVLASSSTLTLDFIKGTVVKDLSEKKQLLIMRILIGVFIAISVVIAIVQYKSNVTFIAQLMGVSWGALAGAFLAPFLYGLYWKRATIASVWVSFLFSSVVMVANIFFGSYFPEIIRSPINAGAFCMFAGLVIVPVVSLVTKPPKAEHVKFVFSCYDKKVTVPVTEAIGEAVNVEE